jgi:hypothetical protein
VTRFLTTLALLTTLSLLPATARAHDAYDDSQSNPLRVGAYLLNPVGWGLEWLIFRPFHFLVSNPRVEHIFGHTPHESPFGSYGPYEPVDED